MEVGELAGQPTNLRKSINALRCVRARWQGHARAAVSCAHVVAGLISRPALPLHAGAARACRYGMKLVRGAIPDWHCEAQRREQEYQRREQEYMHKLRSHEEYGHGKGCVP